MCAVELAITSSDLGANHIVGMMGSPSPKPNPTTASHDPGTGPEPISHRTKVLHYCMLSANPPESRPSDYGQPAKTMVASNWYYQA